MYFTQRLNVGVYLEELWFAEPSPPKYKFIANVSHMAVFKTDYHTILSWSPFYIWGNKGSETLTNVPKITQPKSKGVRFQSMNSFSLYHTASCFTKPLPSLENVFDLHTRPVSRKYCGRSPFFIKGHWSSEKFYHVSWLAYWITGKAGNRTLHLDSRFFVFATPAQLNATH